jgi:hypothetical protein
MLLRARRFCPQCIVLLTSMNFVISARDPMCYNNTALEQARQLRATPPQSSYNGELEDSEWWNSHQDLLKQARIEWGPKHTRLYDQTSTFVDDYLDDHLRQAIREKNTTFLQQLVNETLVPNVYQVHILNERFISEFLAELAHHEDSGIPQRRPNGMNRHGAILSDIGLGNAMQGLAENVIRPLAQTLFPRNVAMSDLSELHSFVVKYEPGQDVQLNEHADASTVTVNICLEPDLASPLYFQQAIHGDTDVMLVQQHVSHDTPGMAMIHLGQHRHGVSPVSGRRSNLVIWLYGEYGYVRVSDYSEEEAIVNRREWELAYGWAQ